MFTTGSPKLPEHNCAFIEKLDAKAKKTNIDLKKNGKGIWRKTGIFNIKNLYAKLCFFYYYAVAYTR